MRDETPMAAPRGPRPRGCLVAVLWALLTHSAVGSAEPLPEPVVVMLVPADRIEESGPIAHVVGSHLSDCDVELRLKAVGELGGTMKERVDVASAVAAQHRALAVFWFDVVTESQMFIYLTGPESSRILVRNLTETDRDGRAEALAVIVHSAVTEMLAGGQIGIAAPSPPSPPPSSPAPADERDWLAIDIAYALSVHSREHPAVHGVDLGLLLFAHPNVALRASYAIMSTIEARGATSSIQVDRHPVSLGVAALLPLEPVVLGLEVDLCLDPTSFRNFHLAEGYEPVADDDDVIFKMRPALLLVVMVVDRLGLFVTAGAEIPFNRKRYVTESAAGEETLLAGWPVQPLVLVGLWVVLI